MLNPLASRPATSVAALHILLALSEGDLHGCGIMQLVRRPSAEQYKMGPGTLYDNLAKLLEQGLVSGIPGQQESGESRREYRLTAMGEKALREEVHRWEQVVLIAKRRLARLHERKA
jgi:DNA-binding PadR family transcriptional regulator